MKKRFFLLLGLTAVLCGSAQHYALFSQYMNNGLVINPAYAGRHELTDVAVSHRRQWTGLSGSPVTTTFSVNSPVKGNKVNLGLVFMDDRIGDASKQNINGIYAYRLQTKMYQLSFGLQAGVEFSRVTWDRLQRNDQNDELILSASTRAIGMTGGAGFYMHNDVSFFGLSVPYILNTNSKSNLGYGPLMFNGGWKFQLKDSSAIQPSMLIRYTGGSPLQYDLNVNYYWKQKYGIGLSYRSNESVVAILEIPFNKQFRFYYSYDFGMNQMRKYHNGSHEIMLRYLLFKDAEKAPETTTEPVTN
jgi:type IX secretion system PorP/SprF family membrane protein